MLDTDEKEKLVKEWKRVQATLLHYLGEGGHPLYVTGEAALLDALSRALQVDLAYQNASLGLHPYRD